jgi:pyridoxine kinase
VRPAIEVREIIDGLGWLGVLSACDAVLSGYLGEAGNAESVRDAVLRVRSGNPNAVYFCDPVIGDDSSGLFVHADVPATFTDILLPVADFAFPNSFELRHLTGGKTDSLESAIASARKLAAGMRPGATVIVTSMTRQDGEPGRIETLAVGPDAVWLVSTPRYPLPGNGAGDSFAALFLGHWGRTRDLEMALGLAVTAIHAVIKATAEAGVFELLLIPMQHELDPKAIAFPPRRVA